MRRAARALDHCDSSAAALSYLAAVAQIVEMGYPEKRVEEVVSATKGDVARAMDMLS